MLFVLDMITEDSTLINQFISVTKDTQGLNTAALVAGLVEGLLDAADFVPPHDSPFPSSLSH